MSFDLKSLAAFAKSGAVSRGKAPVYEISVEEARGRVQIRNADKTAAEDGSQNLSLYLNGKIKLVLDAISPGATVIAADKDDVLPFREALQKGVDEGAFDGAIIEAQKAAKASAEKSAASKAASQASATAAPEGVQDGTPEVDLSVLD